MDRNIILPKQLDRTPSLSARRAWIEILGVSECAASGYVALRKESVDRNMSEDVSYSIIVVALRKESVDRNIICQWSPWIALLVALRKESVDRNSSREVNICIAGVALRKESVDRNSISPPAGCVRPAVALRKESVDRNKVALKRAGNGTVALRKESVDRNSRRRTLPKKCITSLSARRAWIEMYQGCQPSEAHCCRSPQGERG